MNRDTWSNLALGEWLTANPAYVAYVAANPDGAANIGVPLIPSDSGQDLNELLLTAASGAEDSAYVSMGAALADSGPATVYARLFWEMNQWPYNLNPVDFKIAWDRAVPLIRAGFASTARPGQRLDIVFSPISDGADFTLFYPGDKFVDVIAPDVYASLWGTTEPSAASLLASVKNTLEVYSAFAAAHNKAVGLGEWGNYAVQPQGAPTSQGRGDFPEYVNLVLAWAAQVHAVFLTYFDLPDGGVGQTLADTPNSLAALLNAAKADQ